jgi:hypothetical protein
VERHFYMIRIFTFVIFLLGFTASYAQTAEDVAVELSATVQVSPAKITLRWKPITAYTPTYSIFKKAKTAVSWGAAITTLTATDSTYVDNAVVADSGYEYQVLALAGLLKASGYIYAGIRNPAIHSRGTLVLIVDNTFTLSCKNEISTLMNDLSGDGWQIVRHDFARSATDATIKAAIVADNANYANVKAVLLLGHVAVPYSGDLNPDGHPDHLGAWPADVYYGALSGSWTDVTVNDVTAGYAANRNIPGDGKWDQTGIPSTATLQVSRVDFYDMPAFTATEDQMMKSYLVKDHVYKMDSLAMRHRGIIADNFGYFSGEAFAANGWRNFAPIISRDSVMMVGSSMIIPALADSSFQWAYGCGGGTFTSAGGVGATSDFAANPVNGIFTMIFGSYLGDWNVTNNFLRAPLCSPTPALTSCWAGRPNWFLHHMALGENIGYGTLLTQNNISLYSTPSNNGANGVHTALMGDLSLRTDYIKPVINLVVTTAAHDGATLNWTASPDPGVIGYYVYRADSAYGYFRRLNTSMVTATTYHDFTGTDGMKYYQVRPVKLQSTPSGTYYNLGVGLTDSLTVTFGPLGVASVTPSVQVSLFPNPAQGDLNVTVETDVACIASMYFTNEAGQLFSKTTKQLNAGNNRYTVSIADLAPGIYFLMVNTGTATTVQKWVKL